MLNEVTHAPQCGEHLYFGRKARRREERFFAPLTRACCTASHLHPPQVRCRAANGGAGGMAFREVLIMTALGIKASHR